jgi:hypothetical protein
MNTENLIEDLKSHLHGEVIGQGSNLVCDFCDKDIPTDEPVMYDAIKVEDMPNLAKLLDTPEEWVLDASRCSDCEINSINPKTDGYEEALIMISVSEADGLLSADATNLSLIDYSRSDDGYYPPMVEMQTAQAQQDYGIGRWVRMKGLLDNNPPKIVKQMLKKQIGLSREVPPGIEIND